jgi:cytochrome P450
VKTIDDAPFLDIFAADFQADPHAAIDRARQESWLARTPVGGLVIGREQVQGLMADRRLRSSLVDFIQMQGVADGILFDRLSVSLLATEGDDHTRLRKLVSRAFTPRAVERHRPLMREILDARLRPVLAAGRCDFMGAVADHYPIQVMCELLGVPVEDHEAFAEWNNAITWALSFELAAHREEAEWGMKHMDAYVARLVAERRRDPRDDLVTALVQAEEEGDRLSDEELLSMIGGLLFAGYDTTRNQLGLAMWLFAGHPDQWAQLRAHPELAPRAVEEVMRMQGAVDVAPRVVAEDFDLEGYRLTVGTLLSLSTSSANHDPDAFASPHTFDITVERQPQLTFGGGPHYCLGANLARAEMQEALPVLAARMRDLALDGEPRWRPPFGIYGPESLPIRFTPA